MEITLEKIELVKDRTGVSYKEAKDALEAANGSVVDAIINIEEATDFTSMDGSKSGIWNSKMVNRMKATAEKGNMSRIIVRKGNNVLVNVPLTVSVVGAVIAPWPIIIGTIAAAGFGCRVEFVNDQGQITDINGKVKSQYGKAVAQSQEAVDKIKDSELYGDLKDKSTELYDEFKEKSNDAFDRIKASDISDSVKEKGTGFYSELKEKGQDALEELKKKRAEGLDSDSFREGLEDLYKKSAELFKKGQEEIEALLAGLENDTEDAEEVATEEFFDDVTVDPESDAILEEAVEEQTPVVEVVEEIPFEEETVIVPSVEASPIVEDVPAFEEPLVTEESPIIETPVVDTVIDDAEEVAVDSVSELDDFERILDEVERESGVE